MLLGNEHFPRARIYGLRIAEGRPEKRRLDPVNDPLYSFLSARVDKELEALSSVPGLPLPEAAELGRGLLFSRLRDLAEPVVEAWL